MAAGDDGDAGGPTSIASLRLQMCEGRRREPRARPCAVFPPACHTEGTFGIVEGPETLVKLELLNAETAALLASRRLHPTQRFEKRADGTAVLNSGTPDLQSSQLF